MERLRFALCALFIAAASAHASTVSGTLTGVVSGFSTTDPFNIFGGGDLAGASISVFYAYDTSLFPSIGTVCGSNCLHYIAQAPSSGLVSVTVNGKTVVYTAQTSTQISLQNFSPVPNFFPYNYFAEFIDPGFQSAAAVDLGFGSPNAVYFGQPVIPLPGVPNNPASYLTFYQGSNFESLDFLVTPSSAAPEPLPLELCLVGGTAVAWLKRRAKL